MEKAIPLLAHCDWSIHPNGRWMTIAQRGRDGWKISEPQHVGDVSSLPGRLSAQAGHAPVLLGADFPIGLPVRYGRQTEFRNFREALEGFGTGKWAHWYEVTETKDEISVHRPFYPFAPGGKRQSHLCSALGVSRVQELLRHCELPTPHRGAACALFWTLGPNQVGKAAIAGWRQLIFPNLERMAIWPFDGRVPALLSDRQLVLAETYPAEVCHQIGIAARPVWSKRSQQGRASVARHLFD
jgi:hypothetical protein